MNKLMKKTSFFFIFLIIFLIPFSVLTAKANNEKEVTASVLNVRSGPGANYSITGTLKKGNAVSVLTVQGGWSNVQYGSLKGWVSNEYLDSVAITSSTSTQVKITASVLNVRSGAGTTYGLIGTLKQNTIATVIGASGSWTKIQSGNLVGWVVNDYIMNVSQSPTPVATTPVPSTEFVKITATVLNVRSGAGTNYGLVGTLKQNTMAAVLGTSGSWTEIQSGNITGWVINDYIVNVSQSPTPVAPTPAPAAKNVKVTATVLNVRSGAGTSYGLVGTLKQNTVAAVLGINGSWTEVQSGNITGWVINSYIVNTIDSPTVPTTPSTPSQPVVKQEQVNASVLNIRSGAGTNYGIIATLSQGTIVTVTATSGNWSKIQSGNTTGWASSDYLGSVSQNPSFPTSNTGKGKVIVIDPGHGGWDPGSLSLDNKYREADFTIAFATQAKEALESQGYTVYLTRGVGQSCIPGTTNTSDDLKCRVNVSAEHHADLFISIHANWYYTSGPQGTEAYYSTAGRNPSDSERLATDVYNKVQSVINSSPRGVQDCNYYVTKYNSVPATLVEVAFISNPSDLSKMLNPTTQTKVGQAIAAGVNQYFSN